MSVHPSKTPDDLPVDSLDLALAAAFGGSADGLVVALKAGVGIDLPVLVPMPSQAGADSTARYTLIGEIARGGMGVLIHGRDHHMSRELAFKVLREEHQDNPAMRQRFIEEAQIGGLLQHPGIAPIYELGQFGDSRPCFTMKLVKGRTLAKILAERTSPAQDLLVALQTFTQVCQTVAYAHSKQIIHRDLKPANIMIGDFGEVQVMDWGLAKVIAEPEASPNSATASNVDHETQAGEIKGTPAYMAPEQAAGKIEQIGVATDVYGLGAILYEILTGQPPFSLAAGASADVTEVTDRLGQMRQLLLRICREAPTPPRRRWPQAPPALEAVCLKAIAKEPSERYASAGDLARDIQHWLADEPIAGHVEPLRTRLGRWVRKHRTLATSAVAAVVVLLASAIVASNVSLSYIREEQTATLRQKNLADENAVAAENGKAEAERQLKRAETALYASRLAQAHRLWLDGRLTEADTMLNLCPPAFRNWEWNYVHHLVHGALSIYRFPGQRVQQVTWTPDGDLVAAVYHPGETRLKIINLKSNKLLWSSSEVGEQGIMSRDATHYAAWTAGDQGKEIRLWNLKIGDERRFPASATRAVALSPDGKYMASDSAGKVIVWDTASVKPLRETPTADVTALAFNPKANVLLVGYMDYPPGHEDFLTNEPRYASSFVARFDVVTGVLQGKVQRISLSPAKRLALSPDGKILVAGTWKGEVRQWDLETQKETKLPQHTDPVESIDFSPNSHRVCTAANDSLVRINYTDDMFPERILRGPTSVAISRDDRFLAGIAGDTVKILDAYRPQDRIAHDLGAERLNGLSITSDSRRICAFTYYETQGAPRIVARIPVFDVLSGNLDSNRSFELPASVMDAHPSGKVAALVAGSRNAAEQIQPGGARLVELEWGKTIRDLGDNVLSVKFHPDGKRLATLAPKGDLSIWDMESWKALRFDLKESFHTMRFGVQSNRLALASDEEVRILDFETGEVVRSWKEEKRPRGALALSPRGDLLASSQGIWDVSTGQLRHSFSNEADPIRSLAFSPDGKRLATGGGREKHGEIKIWDTDTGLEVYLLKGLVGEIDLLDFTRDGKRLVSSPKLHQARLLGIDVWNAPPPGEVLEPQPPPVQNAAPG